jgi:hypothetical protein
MPFDIPTNAILTLLHEVRVRNGTSRQMMCLRWMMRRIGGGLQENTCHILIWIETLWLLLGRCTYVLLLLSRNANRIAFAMT